MISPLLRVLFKLSLISCFFEQPIIFHMLHRAHCPGGWGIRIHLFAQTLLFHTATYAR